MHKPKYLLWFMILTLILACVPTLTARAPTASPNQVQLFIAQTANAASTQTAAALPQATPTATQTPTPRNTETATPTDTATVIFVLSSPTQGALPTLVIISGGNGTATDYACQILSVTPDNGTRFNPRDTFDTIWKVKNTGTKNWDRTNIDFLYLSGAKIHKIAGYDLSDSVNIGGTIDLGVDMVAPKDSGTYTTTWTLRAGEQTFCNVSLTIVVK